MSIVKDSVLTFITRILFFILQGVAALLLARSLGPEGKGLYSLVVTMPHIAAMISNLGFGISGAYFVSNGEIRKKNIFSLMIIFPLVSGGLFYISLYLLSPVYCSFFPQVPITLFRWALLLIPIISIFNNLLAFLQGEKRFKAYNFINISYPGLFLISFLLLVIGLNTGIRGAVYSWQIGFVGAVLIALLFLIHSFHIALNVPVSDLKKMMKYGAKVAGAELLTFLNYRLDIFLVGYFMGAAAVGWYTVAVVVAETLWFLASSISSVLLPNLTERNLCQAQLLLGKAFRIILWTTLFMLFVLLLMDRHLLNLTFGVKFLPSLMPLRYLYPGVLFLSLSKVLSSYILSRGKPNINMRIAFVGVLFNLFFNLWLIPKLGINGAAISSSISYGIMFAGAVLWYRRQNQIPWPHFLFISKEDINLMFGKILNRKVKI